LKDDGARREEEMELGAETSDYDETWWGVERRG